MTGGVEEAHSSARGALYDKVAGTVITGREDGALSVMGSLMMVLTWMPFTMPECRTCWVGSRPPRTACGG